jgi:hypothetical protein
VNRRTLFRTALLSAVILLVPGLPVTDPKDTRLCMRCVAWVRNGAILLEQWEPVKMRDLKDGDIFQLFEDDDETTPPIEMELDGVRSAFMQATGDGFTDNGIGAVQCEPYVWPDVVSYFRDLDSLEEWLDEMGIDLGHTSFEFSGQSVTVKWG